MSRSRSRTLQLTYLGDASQLSKTTKTAGDDVQTLGERVGRVGRNLAIGFAAIGAAGLAMGKKLFDAFEEVSTANARVESIVDSMGNFEGQLEGTTSRIIAQAEATARLTGVDRNLIKESQALLLTFDSVNKTAGEAGGIFDRATDAAIDLAAAGFGSATSNAQSLGRALEDPIAGLTSLTRQGVTFTEEQREVIASLVESNRTLEAQAIILDAIETQVGGVAEATANGSARIAQTFGILRDRIAEALGPLFEALVDRGLEFIDRVLEWWQNNGDDVIASFLRFRDRVIELKDAFVDFVKAVVDQLDASGSFERLREAFDSLTEQFNDTRRAFQDFRDIFADGRFADNADTFAKIIEFQYIRPLEFLLETIEGTLRALELLFELYERFQAFRQNPFGFRDAPPERDFDPNLLGEPEFAAARNRAATVTNITVQGAVDPEGTARTIIRTLEESRARVGAVTGRLSGAGL